MVLASKKSVEPQGESRPGPIRLLLVALLTITFSLLALGVIAFALEGKDLRPVAPVVVDAGPSPVDVDAPLPPLTPTPELLELIAPVIVACHTSAAPRDPALGSEFRVALQARAGVVELRDATGASPFFNGCLRRRGSGLKAPALHGAVELDGRVEGGRVVFAP